MIDRRSFLRGILVGMGGASALASVAACSQAHACLWDYDTLASEARGVPGVVETLIGGFARNPAAYYEMRLERVTRALATTPDELELYDDAGVACDRLARPDDAIAWMAQKRAALKRIGTARKQARGAPPNHWYRYYANLGTFHAHRWISGADRWSSLADLREAHELIGEAIASNPDAHFGRERYQLRALAWLLKRPKWPSERERSIPVDVDMPSPILPSFIEIDPAAMNNMGFNDYLREHGLDDAVVGLCGLITLGAGWNSLDVTVALARVLAVDGRHALVELARQRCREIYDAGGRSVVIGAPTDETLLQHLVPGYSYDQGDRSPDYEQLRAEALAWSTRREAYMLARLERGEHPDTHPAFWTEFDGDPDRMPPVSLENPPKVRTEDDTGKRGCACAVEPSTDALGLGALAALLIAGTRPWVQQRPKTPLG